MGYLKNLWSEIEDSHKRWVKIFVLVNAMLLIFSLLIIYMMMSSSAEEQTPQMMTNMTDSADNETEIPTIFKPRMSDDDVDAHRELIDLYTKANRPDKSLKHIERVAPHFAEDLVFQTKAANALISSGKFKEAIRYLRQAKKLNSGDVKIAADLALAQFKSGKIAESISEMWELEEKANSPIVSTYLGTMIAETSPKSKEAEELFAKAIELDPKYSPAYYQYSRKLMNDGNFGSARNMLKLLTKMDPMNSKYRARLGMVYFYLFKDVPAEKEYKVALALNDRDYNTWYNLGELFLNQANEQNRKEKVLEYRRKAFKCFQKSINLNPRKSYSAYYKVGLIMNLNMQYKEALDYLAVSYEKKSDYVPGLIQMSVAYQSIGDLGRARKYLMEAYNLDPFNRIIAHKLKLLKNNS